MAAPVVEIDSADITEYIASKNLKLGRTSLDLTLIDPPAVPALDDAVTVDDPAWAGTVVSVTVSDNDVEGHTWVSVTATNADELIVTPAPQGLSDATEDYRKLSITRTKHDGTEEIRGSLETFIDGFLPGHVFALTSDTHGFTDEEFSITDVSVSWVTDETKVYGISFGDELVTLSAWVEHDSGVLPITETKITDGAVSTPKISANGLEATTIRGGTLTLGGVDGTILTVLNADGEPIGEWNEEGLYVTDPSNALLKMRLTNGVLEFSQDGGSTWTTAISGEGIVADAVLVGSLVGGHNRIPNSGFELVAFTSTLTNTWTSAGDWQGHESGDINIDDSTGSLTMNDETY